MHKFLVRALSGIVYAAVIIFATTYGKWALPAMAIAFTVIGVIEFDRMKVGFSKKTLPVFAFDIAGALSLLAATQWLLFFGVWLLLMIIRQIAIRPIVNKIDDLDYKLNVSTSFSVQVYLGAAFALTLIIPSCRLPLLVFVMLWLNDSGAYIVGSLLGRHRMSPTISPKKTWEGFAGGVVITIIGSLLLHHYCAEFFQLPKCGLWIWILMAVLSSVFGTLGDLLESKIKRTHGFKDSGNWIPGHGGLLDRIDSYLVAYPVIFAVLDFANLLD